MTIVYSSLTTLMMKFRKKFIVESVSGHDLCEKFVYRRLVGCKMPALGDFPVLKFPEHAPLMVQVVAVFSICPDVLAFRYISIVCARDQAFGFDVGCAHDAPHGVEEGYH